MYRHALICPCAAWVKGRKQIERNPVRQFNKEKLKVPSLMVQTSFLAEEGNATHDQKPA